MKLMLEITDRPDHFVIQTNIKDFISAHIRKKQSSTTIYDAAVIFIDKH